MHLRTASSGYKWKINSPSQVTAAVTPIIDLEMSSLTLQGATGALLGCTRYAKPDERHDIMHHSIHRFVITQAVAIDEIRLRLWFSRFYYCGPTPKELDDGYRRPSKEQRYKLGKLPPDIGFKLTGDVDCDAGFVVSWEGGWIRGNASGCIMPLSFASNHERAIALRSEIETVLPCSDRKPEIVG